MRRYRFATDRWNSAKRGKEGIKRMSRITMTEGEGKGGRGGDIENAKGSRYLGWFRTCEIRFGLFARVRNKIAATFGTLRLIKLKAEAVIPFQLAAFMDTFV